MTEYEVPESHPRYLSLMTRENIVAGVKAGITSQHGLIAQGRGEAFDYLIGEKTHQFARVAIKVAVASILEARKPVFSINGNAAVLAPGELVALAESFGAMLEVNIFHASKERERAIVAHLQHAGAATVLLPDPQTALPGMEHNRRYVHPEGILTADLVFVPLEDGDRCEALVKAGKTVVTVDLNPASRTARVAQITIVDNLVRVVREMRDVADEVKGMSSEARQTLIKGYDNAGVLATARKTVVREFTGDQ